MYLTAAPASTNLSAFSVTVTGGAIVSVAVTIQNSGQQAGNYSIAGQWVLPGTTTVEGHVGAQGSPTTPLTGSIAGGQTVTVTMDSGPAAYAQQIQGYNPSLGLDLLLSLTDTTTGQSVSKRVSSAVFLPSESPSDLTITGVSVSSA